MAAEFLYLASASPRRRELLDQIGVRYRVRPAAIDERHLAGETPDEYVLRLARAKAEAVWAALTADEKAPVLAADTTVILDGAVLGKPRDAAEAAGMLERLSGRAHEVLTAIALRDDAGVSARVSRSTVRFRPLDAGEIARYWHSGEPRDKAGAYAVQGRAAVFIEHIAGSYSGVMGLPLFETAGLLRERGLAVWNEPQ